MVGPIVVTYFNFCKNVSLKSKFAISNTESTIFVYAYVLCSNYNILSIFKINSFQILMIMLIIMIILY